MKIDNLFKNIAKENYNLRDNMEISRLVSNSSQVKDGDLFIAIKGESHNGHNYIDAALTNGANAAVVEDITEKIKNYPIIKVNNSRIALSKLSANFYDHPSKKLKIIGVTGTNGKTTTTFLINKYINQIGRKCGSIGTLGVSGIKKKYSGFTTPEPIELHELLNSFLKNNFTHIAMEISSHSISLKRVADLNVDVGVFTNLSEDHLDFHNTMQEYFDAKLELFLNIPRNGYAVINVDNKYGEMIIDSIESNVITYGFNTDADIYPITYKTSSKGTEIKLNMMGEIFSITSKIFGRYNIENIMACLGACVAIGLKNEYNKNIKLDYSIPGRIENIGTKKYNVIIDYAHSPDAFESVLKEIYNMKNEKNKIFTLFGCGGDRDKHKRPKMGKIAEKYSNKLFITSDNPRTEKVNDIINDIKLGIKKQNNIQIELNRKKSIISALSQMDQNTILLILGKGHENYQIINGVKESHSDVGIVKEYIQNES